MSDRIRIDYLILNLYYNVVKSRLCQEECNLPELYDT